MKTSNNKQRKSGRPLYFIESTTDQGYYLHPQGQDYGLKEGIEGAAMWKYLPGLAFIKQVGFKNIQLISAKDAFEKQNANTSQPAQ